MPYISTGHVSGIRNLPVAGDLTLIHCLAGLTISFVLTFILARIYKKIHSKKDDCHTIMQSMIFLSVILAGAMMVIGNNLAIAFGLVGAVSIIRFRTAVSSFLDMSFIFVSIVIGMAGGLGFYFLAFIIAAFVGILMLVLNHFKFGMTPPTVREYEITLFVKDSEMTQDVIHELVESIGTSIKFLEYKSMNKKKKFKFSLFINNRLQLEEFEKSICEKFKKTKFQMSIMAK